ALLDAGVDLKGKIIVSAVVNEEIGGTGTEYIVNKGLVEGNACLLGDGPAEYPTAYQGGALQFSFTIKGIRRHAMAYPDLPPKYRNQYSGINAVHKMIPIMNFLMKLQDEFEKRETKYPVHPDLPKKICSVSITKIDGGNAVDTVADNCNLQCLINVIPEQDIYNVRTKVLNFVEELKKNDPDLDIIVQNPVTKVPQITDINSKFAAVVKGAFKTVFNEEREFKAFIPTTDAHYFQSKGIETITIGPFRGDNNIHAQDEFVYINDLINTTKIYALTALNYLKSDF
ncbi:MAG: M20 family metallopeptidase, partial [Candidatus Hodarchaeota archaeon]